MDFFKTRKTVLLLIGFILFAGLAVFSFTHGILQLGHRDPGYYDVGLTDQANAALTGCGAHLIVYEEGSSSEIRMELTGIQKTFSDVLLRVYRLLDAANTYEEIPNIASLNHAPGTEIRIGEELFGILSDALERSGRRQGYNIFAGALFREWEKLRWLDEPADFDPALNSDEAELLDALTQALRDPDMVVLDLTAPDTAVLRIAPEYSSLTGRLEIDAPVLDLNLLHDAYLLRLTADGLKARGITRGYLYCESGCSLWLEEGTHDFTLYGFSGNEAVEAGKITLSGASAYVQFAALPITEETKGYYQAAAGGETLFRHPYIDSFTGEPGKILEYAALAGNRDTVTDLAFHLAALNSLESPEAVSDYLSALPEDISAVWSFRGEEQKLYVRAGDAERVSLDPDRGTELIPVP